MIKKGLQQFRYRRSVSVGGPYWTEWQDRYVNERDCVHGASGLDYQFREKPEPQLEPGLYRSPTGIFYTLSREFKWSCLRYDLTWTTLTTNKPQGPLESLEKVS